MDDHQQHEYGMPDLSQLLNNNRSTHHFIGISQVEAEELLPGHQYRNLTPQPQGHHHHHYEMLMMPRGLQDFNSTAATTSANNANNNSTSSNNINNTTSVVAVTATATATASVSTPSFSGFEGEAAASFGGDVGNGRWPRQETLTLLEIRSRLDSKFKETNQKAPLWDEVSRIMCEEHGYQRSGKKCREKFENLYKYYKKTREGKAGRQDGKHYRFFRQLEALYGDSTSNSSSVQETHLIGSSSLLYNHSTTHHQDQITTIFPSSHKLCGHSMSLSNNNNSSQFDSSSSDDNDLSIMDNDSTEINRRNKKRGSRSGWKVKVKEFIDSQMRKLMGKQEAWLEKLTKTLEQKEQDRVLREEQWRRQEQERIDREQKFWAKERAWIEARDAVLTEALQNLKGKKLKTDDQSPTEDPMAAAARLQLNDIDSSSPAGAASNNTNNVGNAVSDSCFRYLMADGDHLWENYGLKLRNNGENQISE